MLFSVLFSNSPQSVFSSYLDIWRINKIFRKAFNPLTPNDLYISRTAPLTSKRCILYIYSTNVCAEYFKPALYSPFFPLQNAVCFIVLTCLVPVLFTFYIQDVPKLKNNNSGAKGLISSQFTHQCKIDTWLVHRHLTWKITNCVQAAHHTYILKHRHLFHFVFIKPNIMHYISYSLLILRRLSALIVAIYSEYHFNC